MKRLTWILCAATLGAAAIVAAPASRADVDISFSANAPIPLHDDPSLFFNISSRYFNQQPTVIMDWGRRFRNPDDLAVFMYIVQRSRKSTDEVYRFRRQGMSWYDVGMRCGVPFDAWYVTVNGRPRGRYARPYGAYDRFRTNNRMVRRLTDAEIRDLVAIRMAHEYYGVSPEIAMDWRRSGSNLQIIMTREYHNRHRGDRDRWDRRDRDDRGDRDRYDPNRRRDRDRDRDDNN